LKRKAQVLFLACIILVVFILFPFTTCTYQSVMDFWNKMPEGYRWPQMTDFWFTLLTSIVFMILEKAFDATFYGWFYEICKEKEDLNERKRRTRKAV
jgi:ABC-type sulfate transport system permease component